LFVRKRKVIEPDSVRDKKQPGTLQSRLFDHIDLRVRKPDASAGVFRQDLAGDWIYSGQKRGRVGRIRKRWRRSGGDARTGRSRGQNCARSRRTKPGRAANLA